MKTTAKQTHMKKVAIIGTQGVPAKYGGFETLVENIIGDNCSPNVQYTIICSSKDLSEKHNIYKRAILKYIPLHANGIQSIPYDIISILKVIKGYDTILILGVSGCIILPIIKLVSKAQLIINIDGLEHRRDKWGKLAKKFLKFSESMAVKFADIIIADNKGIQNYVSETYHKNSTMIAYGGDHVLRNITPDTENRILEKYGLNSKNYAISICRIEPENNCHIILQAFSLSNKNLIFIGNWDKSDYGRKLKAQYKLYNNIKIIDPNYDLDTLYILRKHCNLYVHGHSAGGTNPSLVEAMFFGQPIIAFDVIYNRETTKNQAYYFTDVTTLLTQLEKTDLNGRIMEQIARSEYSWSYISQQYNMLYK